MEEPDLRLKSELIVVGRSERESVESRLCCSGLMESLIMPLQEQIDEWKKTAVHLDKDHTHGLL